MNVLKKTKGNTTFFATLSSGSEDGHLVYLSGYGAQASELLDKYFKEDRAGSDHEEMFKKWDESISNAFQQVGFSRVHEVEDGYVYITSFQNGIGVTSEDEMNLKRSTARGRRRRVRISIISPELTEGFDMEEDMESGEINLPEDFMDTTDLEDDQ